MRSERGVTLIELVVTTAVVGLMLAIGIVNIPVDRFAVRQGGTGLARDFQMARFEAINRNEFVGIRIDVGADEYVLVIDMDRDGVLDETAGDRILKRVELPLLTSVDGQANGTYVFDTRGMVLQRSFSRVELASRGGSFVYSVCVSIAGQATTRTGATCT